MILAQVQEGFVKFPGAEKQEKLAHFYILNSQEIILIFISSNNVTEHIQKYDVFSFRKIDRKQ